MAGRGHQGGHHRGDCRRAPGRAVPSGALPGSGSGGLPGGGSGASRRGGRGEGAGPGPRGLGTGQSRPAVRGGDMVPASHRGPGGHRLRHPEQQRLCRHRHRMERRHRAGLQRPLRQLTLRVGGVRRAGGGGARCGRPAADLVADAGGLFRAGHPGDAGHGGGGAQPPSGGPVWGFQ